MEKGRIESISIFFVPADFIPRDSILNRDLLRMVVRRLQSAHLFVLAALSKSSVGILSMLNFQVCLLA